MIKDEFFVLSNGVKIPVIGFGTWQIPDGENCYQAVRTALELGYRHIDTAKAYGNEASVGKAIRDSGIPREEIFVTTKLPAEIKGYEACMKAFKESFEALNIGYIDLYLIHCPWPWDKWGMDCTQGNIDSFKAMIDLYHEGKIRSIGVSNFNEAQIQSLIDHCSMAPMVNQVHYSVAVKPFALQKWCEERSILMEAYAPNNTGHLVNCEALKGISEKYHKTIPQICIRYCYQNHALPLPKTVHEEYMRDNFDIDFEIEEKDMEFLRNLVI